MMGARRMIVLATVAVVFSSGLVLGAMSVSNGPGASGDLTGVDYGLDTNENGLYDYLVVKMLFDAENPGYYNVNAQLFAKYTGSNDCYGDRWVTGPYTPEQEPWYYPISYAYVRVFMEQSDDTIKIAFNGKDIYGAGSDGPYKVQVYVWGDSDPWYYPIMPTPYMDDGAKRGGEPPQPWEYVTGDYKFTAFEKPTWAIEFTGSNSDSGIDLNGNGLYDVLRVTSQVQVNLAGSYEISATLTKEVNATLQEPYLPDDMMIYPPENLFVSYWARVNLSAGLQTIDFDLSGEEIRASGIDGPYDVYMSVSYLFYPYPYPYIYYNLSDPDAIVPRMPGQPFLPGLQPDVQPGSWCNDGLSWCNESREQPYDFYYDNTCHKTQAYSHDQFDEAPPDVVFTGDFSDMGVDWNSNGLYEELQVDVGIEVLREGYFAIGWSLSSYDGSQVIYSVGDMLYLGPGVQTVSTRIPGLVIRDSGIDGPYTVHINILRVQRPRDPEASYTTSFYTHDQFEGYNDSNDTRLLWLESLEVRAAGEPPSIQGAAAVTVRRGMDVMDVVMDGTVQLTIADSEGNTVYSGFVNFSIASGGVSATVSFTFSLSEHGDYIATACLTSFWCEPDTMRATFQA